MRNVRIPGVFNEYKSYIIMRIPVMRWCPGRVVPRRINVRLTMMQKKSCGSPAAFLIYLSVAVRAEFAVHLIWSKITSRVFHAPIVRMLRGNTISQHLAVTAHFTGVRWVSRYVASRYRWDHERMRKCTCNSWLKMSRKILLSFSR